MSTSRILDVAARWVTPNGTSSWTPGDQGELCLRVSWTGSDSVAWPTHEDLGASFIGVTLLGEPTVSSTTTSTNPVFEGLDASTAEACYPVQVLLAPGLHELGEVELGFLDESADTLTMPLQLTVGTGLTEELSERLEQAGDEALPQVVLEEMAPLRGPRVLKGELPWGAVLFGTMAAFLILGGLAWLGWRLWQRRALMPAAPPAPPPPPEVEARHRLESLPPMLDRGEHLEYHVELAETLKRYLSRRYSMDFLEQTTDELRRTLQSRSLRQRSELQAMRDGIASVLSGCDLVKFARDAPARDESLRALEKVEEIVDRTTPRPVVESETDEEEAA
ncbi:MAG: hypothetical protein AAF533_12345 [Acidobacteriota bacterium]